MSRLRALFFRENSPALTQADKQIIDVLVRGPKTGGDITSALSRSAARRTVYNRLEILEKMGIVKKRGDFYHGGPIVELEARNTLLGLISFIALLVGIFTNNVPLLIFSIICLVFASNRKLRYEAPRSKPKPSEQAKKARAH